MRITWFEVIEKGKYASYLGKLILKACLITVQHDQCRAVYLASHLWWAVEIPARNEEDGKLVI